MMKSYKKRVLSLMLIVAMLIGMLPSNLIVAEADESIVSGICGNNITWTLDKGTGVLELVGSGTMYDYCDPLESNGADIPWWNYREIITQIKIGEGITRVGNYAFTNNCENGYCLTSVTLPNSLLSIGDEAFSGQEYLSSIHLPSNLKSIGSYAFYNCYYLNTTLPNSLTNIGIHAFSNCERLNTNIPVGINQVEACVFSCCGFTNLCIPDNIRTIGDGAFEYNWELYNVTIPSYVTKIDDYAFRQCEKLKSVNIPYSVLYLGRDAFANCFELEKVDLQANITQIKMYTFTNCFELKEINIPNTVVNIEKHAFSYSGLESVEIPVAVNNIDTCAFYECSSLKKIYFKGSAPTIASDAFKGVTATAYYINDGTWTFDKLQNYGGNITWVACIDEDSLLAPNLQDTYSQLIQNKLPNIKYDCGTLKGPEINILGKKTNLFEFDMKLDISLGDKSKVNGSAYYDPETQTVKYMFGISDEEKAKIEQGTDASDTRWRESYYEVKSFIKACGKETHTTNLWNKYSTLKGKLRKSKATMGLDAGGNITGYLEFKVENGDLRFIEGGVSAVMEASAKTKFPIYGSVVYAEIGLGGEFGSELVIKADTMETFALVGKVNMALKPSAGIVADLKVIEGKAVFSGDIGLDINFPFKSPEESIQGYIQGKFTLSVNSPMNIIKFSMTKKYPKMELYPNLGEIIEESSVMAYNMRLLSAAVDEIPTEGLIEFSERNKETPVYEDAKPQLVELSDGRKLLVYIDDDGTKSEGNHTTLMYSIQENGVWSAPAAVNETGRADSAPVIHYDGTGVHVIWLNVSVEVTEEQLEEVLSNVDLCYAYFDGTEFGETMVISEANNGKIEYYYSIAAKEGETTIMWVDNSENDFMMTSGTNTVYKRIITEEGLGDITTAATATTKITQTACDYISDTLYSAYIKNGELYVGSTSYKSKAANVSNIEYIDDKLYYLNDTLKYYDNSKSVDTKVVPSSRFTVVGDRVYWLDYDGDYCEIFVQTIGQDNVAMVTDDNGHINSMSVIEKADGDTAIAYIYQNLNVNFEDDVNPFGTSFMKYYEEKEMYDLSIENVAYDCMDIENGGEMSIDFDIRNNGVTDIEGAVLKLYNPYYEVIKEVAIEDVITSGNSITSSVTITLPEDISDYCVIVTVGNDNILENVLDNNSCTLELENTDVSMVMDETYGVEIENIGNCTARDVSLYVYEDSAYGEIIKQIDIGEITPGQKVSYSDEELIEAFDFESIDDINYYYYVVKTSSIDVNEGNNSDIKTRRPIAAEKVILSSELVEMYLGDSVDIVAEISPDNAYFKDVIWTSSNEKVATVDDNGKVKAVSAGVSFIRAETKAEGVFALAAVSVVKKKDISVGSIGNYVYSGSEITPEIKVYSDGIRLYENRDYTLEYANNKNAGTAKVIVTGIGDYQGTVNKTFTIAKKNISEMKAVLSNSKYTYNGKAKKPTVTISGLKEGTDYTISYSSNIKPGKATVTITGKGNYTGTITNSFTILPSQVKSPKQVTASTYTTKMKLTWGKCTGVTGYEIYRSTSKNGTYKKVKTITSNTNSSTITGLKAGTKYYYKVRAYKTVDGQKIYGTFSTVLQTVTKPKAPTSIKVSPATKKATVTWTKATGAVGYEVYMATSKNGTYKKIGATTSALKYVKAGLTSGKKYYYKVRAYTKTSAGTKLYSGFTSVKSVTVK